MRWLYSVADCGEIANIAEDFFAVARGAILAVLVDLSTDERLEWEIIASVGAHLRTIMREDVYAGGKSFLRPAVETMAEAAASIATRS